MTFISKLLEIFQCPCPVPQHLFNKEEYRPVDALYEEENRGLLDQEEDIRLFPDENNGTIENVSRLSETQVQSIVNNQLKALAEIEEDFQCNDEQDHMIVYTTKAIPSIQQNDENENSEQGNGVEHLPINAKYDDITLNPFEDMDYEQNVMDDMLDANIDPAQTLLNLELDLERDLEHYDEQELLDS